jgi:hypothetical protein
MAKKTYKLLRFDGGINNDADPRDIGDNQLAVLENVAVDEVGKLIVLGDASIAKTSFKDITGGLSVNGRGLFAFSTDYNGIIGDSSGEKVYYLVEDGGDVRGEQGGVSTTEADAINGINTNSSVDMGAIGTPTFYSADGVLRVGDADHSTPTPPRWKGYVKRVTWGYEVAEVTVEEGHTYNIDTEGWKEQSASIKGCFEPVDVSGSHTDGDGNVTVGLNLIAGQGYGSTYYTGSTTKAALFGFADEDCDTGTGPTDLTHPAGGTNMFWGLGMHMHSLANGTGSWQPDDTTSYQFYATTMFDEHTQESLPQLFTMYPNHAFGDTAVNYEGAKITTGFKFSDNETWGTSGSPGIGEMVTVSFSPVVKWNGLAHGVTVNGPQTSAYGAMDANGVGDASLTSGGNPRISGNKIYWASSEDGFSTKWMLMDWYFKKGVKAIGSAGSTSGDGGYVMTDSSVQIKDNTKSHYYNHVHGNGVNTGSGSSWGLGFQWKNPPKLFQYDVFNGHAPDDKIEVDSFKTAVVANRRVYIGNVQQDGVIQEDRMIKSPVNQFDKFPSINNIDVAVNDGDAIVHLIEYADRIIQFKKNAAYIINISGAAEYLEAEHKFKGISNPGAACRMDYGVAWVNQNGCYLYNGQQVTDLLEDKGMRKINQAAWSTFIGTNEKEVIGFNPKKRQLIVKGDSTDVHLYDMVTKSWTKGIAAICDNNHSNFINSPEDGRLLIFDDSNNNLDDWEDSPSADKPIVITTKDIDFGEPAVRKKVYKVYITYKSASYPSTVNVAYDTDGQGSFTNITGGDAVTPFAANSAWTMAEYRFGSDANSCKSIQLKISGTADTTFEINDISFIYRVKSIK